MAKEKKMEHTKDNLALLLDKLSSEERLLADREENKGRLGLACDHLAKSNAYLKASLLVRFAPEFDKEAKRLSLGG
jgi:hypothetical protein